MRPLALSHATEIAPHADEPSAPETTPVGGLDLLHLTATDGVVTAPAEGGTAQLTLDPELQRIAVGLMNAHHLPEAAVVLLDTATGKVLVYASHVEKGAHLETCAPRRRRPRRASSRS